MEVRVLGPIEVHGDHKLAIGGPRQRRIIAALAMHADNRDVWRQLSDAFPHPYTLAITEH